MRISKYQKLYGVGPLGAAFGLILLILLWLLDGHFNHLEILSRPWPLRLTGLLLIGLWICWHIWCLRTIRSCWDKERLCTTGPYRYVQHPIYSGGIWGAGIGIILVLNSWILLLWPVLSYTIWSILVRKEEKMLAAIFGEAHKRYVDRTGRLFPKLF